MRIAVFAASLLLLAFTGWIVAKATVWVRIAFVLLAISFSVWCAYVYGRSCERLLCLGTYVRSFERYSTMLSNLAREGRHQELAQDVIAFDEKWKADLQSRAKLDALVTELETTRSSPR